MGKRNVKNEVRTPQGIGSIFLNRCLPLLLAFLFGFNLYSAESQTNRSYKENSYSLQEASLGHLADRYFQRPVHTQKISLSIESITEPEEDVEVDGLEFAYQTCCALAVPPAYLLENKLSVLPELFYSNEHQVPLYILFHSWKNYLH